MNRTMATKMIVMSNEFRTRGSMPGAIRSEIIRRSSACAAMRYLLVRVCDNTIGLDTGVVQERCQKSCADGERRDQDVLVRRVRAAALGPEAVEHGDAEGA